MPTSGDGVGRADWPQQGSQAQDDNSHSHSGISSSCGGQSESRLHLPLRTGSPGSVGQTDFQLDHTQRQVFNAGCPQQQPFDLFSEAFPPYSLTTDLFGEPSASQLLDQNTFELGSQILPADPAGAATASNLNPITSTTATTTTTRQPPLLDESPGPFPTVVPSYSHQQHPAQDETRGKSPKGKGLEIAPAINPTHADSSLRSWPHPPLLPRTTSIDWPLPPAPRSDKPKAPPMPRHAASADRRQEKDGPSTATASAAPSKSSRTSPKVVRKRARVEDEAEGAEAGEQSPDPTRDAEPSGQRKKTRGRPRKVNSGDVGHTERRRQQIREAQRAYRARKDSAITDLEERLLKAHEKMNTMAHEFSNFIDFASTKGALSTNNNVEVSRRLQDISSKFQTMASESASAGVDISNQPGADPSSSSALSNASGGNGSRPLLPVPRAGTSVHDSSPSFVDLTQGLQSDSSYEILTHPTLNNASFPDYDPNAQIPDDFDEELPLSSAPCYVEAIGPGLQAPSSYCFQELTFGRRLQRNMLERGLRLALMDSPPPLRYGAVFGFCLLFESRESIAHRLAARLQAPEGESLNNWTVPFTNLGSIGWHYPANAPSQSDTSSLSSFEPAFGNQGTFEANKTQLDTGYSMGPWDAAIETTKDVRIGKKMQILMPGFTGEFLDSGEIELYLRQRGILIQANSDVVAAEIDPDDFNGAVDVFAYNKPRNVGPRLISGPNMGPSLFTNGSAMRAPETDSIFPFLCPAIPSEFVPIKAPRRITIEINVSVLEEELCSNAVCLGRTPAVRPKDVDAAIRNAGLMTLPNQPPGPIPVTLRPKGAYGMP